MHSHLGEELLELSVLLPKVRYLIRAGFARVSAAEAHTCGVMTNGSAFCWGAGADGRLGTGNENSQSIAARVISG